MLYKVVCILWSKYCHQHFFQVPYEILNKKFRTAQKNIDREVSHVQSATLDLEKELSKSMPNMTDITKILGGVVDKLNILKRKVGNLLLVLKSCLSFFLSLSRHLLMRCLF